MLRSPTPITPDRAKPQPRFLAIALELALEVIRGLHSLLSTQNRAMTEEYQLPPTDSSRKARLSAATLGLALSMGATSLLLPRQGDEVRAAEPPSSASTSLPTAGSSRLHVVQAGETLAQVARQHHLTLAALVRANSLAEGTVLESGQVLRLPEFSSNSVSVVPPVAPAPSVASLTPPVLMEPMVAASPEVTAPKGPEVTPLATTDAPDASTEVSVPQAAIANALPTQDRAAIAGLAAELRNLASVERQTVASALEARSSLTPAPRPMVVRPRDGIVAAPDSVKQPAMAAAAATLPLGPNGLDGEQRSGDVAQVPAAAPSNVPAAATTLKPQLPALASGLGTAAAGGDRAWRETLLRIQNGEVNPTEGPQVIRASDRHVVRPGDTLSTIAQQYGVSARELAQVNGVENPRTLAIGRELAIPVALTSVTASVASDGAAQGEATVVATPDAAPIAASARVTPESFDTPTPGGTAAIVAPIASTEAVASSRGVGAAVQAAAVRPQAAAASLSTNPYLASLKAEVNSLRDRYQVVATAEPAATAAPRVAQATDRALVQRTEATAVPVQGLRGEAAAIAITQEPPSVSYGMAPQTESAAEALGERSGSTQVALASPSLSDPQDSRVQPLVGRMVSPDLPGLSGAEAYIPGASRFSGEYAWPARGILTSGYGWRWGRMHRGIDIAAPTGTPISAAADGVVEFAGWNSGGYGNLVDVRHPDGSLTRYAHNSRLMVRRGQSVQQGQLIAEMGSTGRSTGPHLHFEIHRRGQGALNPVGFLPQGGLRAAR